MKLIIKKIKVYVHTKVEDYVVEYELDLACEKSGQKRQVKVACRFYLNYIIEPMIA